MKTVIFFICLLFLASCTNIQRSGYKEATTIYKALPLKPSITSVVINSTDSMNPEQDYLSLKTYDLYFYFYNSKSRAIEVLGQQDTSALKIDLSFLANKGDVYDVCIHNMDTIFVSQTGQISLINSQGKLIKFWNLLTDSTTRFYLGKFTDGFPIVYNNETRSLYLQRFFADAGYNYGKSLGFSLESSLNIDASFTDTLNIYPSELYALNLGAVFPSSRCAFGNYHVYSFAPDPNLYVYNLESKSVLIKGGKSSHQNKSVSTYPIAKSDSTNFKHELEMLTSFPQYTAINYNPATGFFYRLFMKEIDFVRPDGLFNTYRDKECYLMVLDTNFCVVNEFKIPNKYGVTRIINMPHGVALVTKRTARNIELDNFSYE